MAQMELAHILAHLLCLAQSIMAFDRWAVHHECLKNRRELAKRVDGASPDNVVVGFERMDVVLDCHSWYGAYIIPFEIEKEMCLFSMSPLFAYILEDEWRTDLLINFIDGLSIRKYHEHRNRELDSMHQLPLPDIPETNLTGYRWERLVLNPRTGQKEWMHLVPKGKKIKEKQEFANPVSGKNETYRLHSQWQLIIYDLQDANRGWYRCYNNYTSRAASYHHVSVKPFSDYPLRNERVIDNDVSSSTDMIYAELGGNDKVIGKSSPWMPCNKCGVKGESRRRVECYVSSPKKSFKRFGQELPCHSSLLPAEYSVAVEPHRTTVEQIRDCHIECPPSSENATRVVRNMSGKAVTVRANHYGTDERPPHLPSAAMTHTVKVPDGGTMVLDCPTDESLGVVWKNYADGASVEMDAAYLSDNSGALITVKGQLVWGDMSDDKAGQFMCYTRGNDDVKARLAAEFWVILI